MNHESLSIPEDGEVWCELEERQYQRFKARLDKEWFGGPGHAVMDVEYRRLCAHQDADGC